MLAKTKLKKLEKELNELQKKTSVRNLNMDEIVAVIEQAEEEIKSVRKELRTSVMMVYFPWSVANSYKYRAYGTAVIIEFSKSGKAILARVLREPVKRNGEHCFRIKYTDITEFIESHLGVIREEADSAKYNNIVDVVLNESGFNHYLKRNL